MPYRTCDRHYCGASCGVTIQPDQVRHSNGASPATLRESDHLANDSKCEFTTRERRIR